MQLFPASLKHSKHCPPALWRIPRHIGLWPALNEKRLQADDYDHDRLPAVVSNPTRPHLTSRHPTRVFSSPHPTRASCDSVLRLYPTRDSDPGSDGDWSDLEDFIVCQPERNYGKLLAKKYYYAADEVDEEEEDGEGGSGGDGGVANE